MSPAPERPWQRTDPDWVSQARAGASRAGAVNPVAALRLQAVSAVAELRAAGPLRLGLGSIGIVAIVFGAVRILTNPAATKPVHLAIWLAAAVVLHDGIAAPVTVVIGYLVARVVHGRMQAYVQAALAVAAVTAVIALPQIYRRGKSAPGTTLLHRNYALNLLVIVGIVVVIAAVVYAVNARRAAAGGPDVPGSAAAVPGSAAAAIPATGRGATSTNERPPHDH